MCLVGEHVSGCNLFGGRFAVPVIILNTHAFNEIQGTFYGNRAFIEKRLIDGKYVAQTWNMSL